MEKQLEQLSCFINRVASDVRLKPTHTSLSLALCHSWIRSQFANAFSVSRKKLMKAAHIQSIVTYHKVITDLQIFGYLDYLPSYHPSKGSTVTLREISNTSSTFHSTLEAPGVGGRTTSAPFDTTLMADV
jgi:hypothetical protein